MRKEVKTMKLKKTIYIYKTDDSEPFACATKEEFDLIVAEFENSLREYEGAFSVEDIMWVEIQPLIY